MSEIIIIIYIFYFITIFPDGSPEQNNIYVSDHFCVNCRKCPARSNYGCNMGVSTWCIMPNESDIDICGKHNSIGGNTAIHLTWTLKGYFTLSFIILSFYNKTHPSQVLEGQLSPIILTWVKWFIKYINTESSNLNRADDKMSQNMCESEI